MYHDIEHYLALDFPDNDFPAAFPALIHSKTEGSPRFMVALLQNLRHRGVIAQHDGR